MPPTETTSLMDPLVGNQNNNDNGDDRLEMGRFKSNETSFVTLPESSSSSSPSSTSLEDNRGNNSRTSAPHYDPDDQWRIIFQLSGSVWPRVAPWCCAVSVFTYVVYALKEHNIVDLTIASNAGHNFMSLLVSFLLVTRATVVYQRFMEARQCLSDLYRNGRELVHHSCIFADHTAVQWRRTVAYKTILTLRMATAALEFRSHKITPWDSLHHEDDQDETPIFMHNNRHHALTELMHGERTTIDESFRAPITWALNLRQCLLKTRKNDNITDLLPVEEMKLLQFCSDMIKSYEGAAKLVRTPMPFPLVQMTATFLLFWVWTLPLVLIGDNHQPVEVMIVMFFLCYGFLGLENVSRELDDPYGDDPNDFLVKRWEQLILEDIYIAIFKTDGIASARILKTSIDERIRHGNALDNYHEDISSSSFWSNSGRISSF